MREWTSGPLVNPPDIEKRLDAVEYFLENPAVHKGCQEVVRGLMDLEQSLVAVINAKIRTREFCKTVSTIDGVNRRLAKVWSEEVCSKNVPKVIQEIVARINESFKKVSNKKGS